MKTTKIFLLVLLAFAGVDCFSQNYGEEYLERLCLPSAFSTCRSVSSPGDIYAPNARLFIRPVLNAGDTIVEIEQFYTCDSTARLAGVAFLGTLIRDSDTLMSFRLRDVVSDTIITEVYKPFFNSVYQPEGAGCVIFEYLFDDVLTINRDFSLSLWFPEEFYEEGINSRSWNIKATNFNVSSLNIL